MDEVGFAEGFEDAVVEFGFVEAFGGLGPDRYRDFAGHVGKVGDGVPGFEKLVAIRRE